MTCKRAKSLRNHFAYATLLLLLSHSPQETHAAELCSPEQFSSLLKATPFQSRFKKFHSLNEVPEISLKDFDAYKEVPKQAGMGTEKILLAERNGKKFFVKVSKARVDGNGLPVRTNQDLINESSWATALYNEFGFGPKLNGTTVYEGHYALVFDWSDGVQLLESMPRLPFTISDSNKAKAIGQMNDTLDVLLSVNIDPVDIQFRISREGDVTLIDTEAYRFMPSSERADRTLKLKEKVKALAKVIMQSL